VKLKSYKGGEDGMRDARWYKVTFTFDFLALKGLNSNARDRNLYTS